MRTSLLLRTAGLAVAALLLLAASAMAQDASVRVSNGSPFYPFSQNKQNEPAVAIDAANPYRVASGSNDNINMEACNSGDDTDCPFTEGVGVSGLYLSSSSGQSWKQPSYRGYTASGCQGVVGPDAGCTPTQGPIGTLPNYYEAGLVSDGDPALAFGPRYVPGSGFSRTNLTDTTLYYANLTSAFPGKAPFKGAEAIAVSRTTNTAHAFDPSNPGTNSDWSAPVIASKQSSAQFSDKEQIWADNAASSPYYGNVYVCYANFRSNGPSGNQPLDVLISRDGARSFTQKQVTSATNNTSSRNGFGRSGCSVRTDSKGTIYVFDYQFSAAATATGGAPGKIQMIKSTDGGNTFGRPQNIFTAYDTCGFFEPSIGRCVEDGVGGARSDLSPAPSVDIANGAPSGSDATDRLVLSWVDGQVKNQEKVQYSTSPAGGGDWSEPIDIRTAGDRGYYSAPAISPDGQKVYVVYNAFTTPYQDNTSATRNLVGVVKTSPARANPTPADFTTANRTAGGDPRASSQNNLAAEFLGDYVYAAATRTYGTSVWNDVRNGADCPAVDAYRQKLHDDAVQSGAQTAEPEEPRGMEDGKEGEAVYDPNSGEPPAPQQDCLPVGSPFGETDIYGVTTGTPATPPAAARR
jgi:hypothetical protein